MNFFEKIHEEAGRQSSIIQNCPSKFKVEQYYSSDPFQSYTLLFERPCLLLRLLYFSLQF